MDTFFIKIACLLAGLFNPVCVYSETTVPTNEGTTNHYTAPKNESSCKITLGKHTGESNVQPSIEKSEVALLLLLGFAGFSLVIAGLYKQLRKYVFHDEHNFDTIFDAGGRVSLSLTAVTVTSQLLWPTDFLQSATLTSKSGLGGSLWMAVGVFVDIHLFPVLSVYLKTRAPGAKTFPQIAYARFGKVAHIMFCILALMASIIVSTSIMLAGRSAIQVLSKNSNNEFIFLLIAVLFGSYCMVGGLGTTFYISYFNTAITFISISVYILYTSFYATPEVERYASLESMFKAATCLHGPDGNFENSYLTFRSKSGIIYGIIILFMATSINFCDQANWQSRIAAKPSQGLLGFFIAAYMWFVIPTALSFTATMTYFSISFQNGTHLLSELEIDDGYITPYVMNYVLGEAGGYLLMTILMMALMSTGSGEIMAISSIIVYDIYKTYINPFRKGLTPTSCILCGKEKLPQNLTNKGSELCSCPTSIDCKACDEDIEKRAIKGAGFNVHYTCPVHAQYRHYEDGLMRYKTWCMVWVVISIVPYGLLISETDINLNWATLGITIFTCPFLFPLFLTITWSKATSHGIVAGGVVGLACSIAGMLIMGATYDNGLNDFFVNTVQDYSLLCSMISGFVVSGAICIGVSLCTHNIQDAADVQKEWAKTINIDNPLSPFRLVYEEELKEVGAGDMITAETMDRVFRKAKIVGAIAGVVGLILFVIVTAIALSIEVLTEKQFTDWIRVFQIWVFVATALVVIVPPVEEGVQIWRKYKENKVRRQRKQMAKGETVLSTISTNDEQL